MKLHEAQLHFSRINYRTPLGASFCSVEQDYTTGNIIVRLVVETNDADAWPYIVRGPGTEVNHEWNPTEFAHLTAEELIDWCYEAARGLALHEVEEHFRVDGVRYRDPHPKPSALAGYKAWLELISEGETYPPVWARLEVMPCDAAAADD